MLSHRRSRRARRIIKCRCLIQRDRIGSTSSGKCSRRRIIPTEPGVIGVICKNIRRVRATNRYRDAIENCDGISRENFLAVAAERYIGDEIELTVATGRIKFQRRISR